MARHKIQAEVLLAVAVILIAIGAVCMAVRPDEQPDQTISTPYGDVKWNHDLHARLKEFNCQVCHHEARPGTTNPDSCTDCHKRLGKPEKALLTHHELKKGQTQLQAAKDASPAMIAFHAKCIGCHKAVDKGPVGCRECQRRALCARGG